MIAIPSPSFTTPFTSLSLSPFSASLSLFPPNHAQTHNLFPYGCKQQTKYTFSLSSMFSMTSKLYLTHITFTFTEVNRRYRDKNTRFNQVNLKKTL